MKKTMEKVQGTLKAINKFLNSIYKSYSSMKKQLSKIWLMLTLAFIMMSCGTTRVSVNRPDNGTYTQITVTTNNPITTSTDADANATLDMKGGKQ